MKSIISNNKKEYIINKSRFICNMICVNDIEDVNKYLLEIKNKYKDATHNCYAYIVDGFEKCSDDGEPAGTAGIPILNVLKNNELNHILCIVTRYFGGIKLGTGGLVRAYTKSVTNCIDENNICNLIPGIELKITFSYDNIKQIDNYLKDIKIISKEFNNDITYVIDIDKNNKQLINSLNKISQLKILKEILIKKEKNSFL